MTREEFNILDEWVFAEVKHNRDNYSRAKIIELIMERAEELVNENDSLHLVSHCPLCNSDNLHQYKLHHIHCKDCKEDFNKSCG
jgi:transposase-like protein